MPKIVPEQDKLDTVISCRLSADEQALVIANAAQLGITKGEYMRRRLCDLPLPQVPVKPRTPQGIVDGLSATRAAMSKDQDDIGEYIHGVQQGAEYVTRDWALQLCIGLKAKLNCHQTAIDDLLAYAEEYAS